METTVSMIGVILYAIATLLPLLFWLNRPLSSREFRGAKSERLRQLFWRWFKWGYLWGSIGGVGLLGACRLGRGDGLLYLCGIYLAILWLSVLFVITVIDYYWLNQIIHLKSIDKIGILCLFINFFDYTFGYFNKSGMVVKCQWSPFGNSSIDSCLGGSKR
jgi:hypothetical protein